MILTMILAVLCLCAIYVIKTNLKAWWAQAFWLLNLFGAVLLGHGAQMFFAPLGIIMILMAYTSYKEVGEDKDEISRILEVGKYNPNNEQ
jgi:hypothetical protein